MTYMVKHFLKWQKQNYRNWHGMASGARRVSAAQRRENGLLPPSLSLLLLILSHPLYIFIIIHDYPIIHEMIIHNAYAF